MIPRISAKFETTLAIKVDIGDEQGTLTSITDADGTALPNGTYGFTIDEGNSDFEYIECTITGTAITNVKSYSVTNLTETTGFTKSHRAGAEVKITDYTILGKLVGIFRGTQNMDAATPIKYGSAPTLSDNNALATVGYVLGVVTGGTVTFNSNIIAGVAGEAIASGEWVYFKESDGRWYKTDANLEETCIDVKIGKALGAATVGAAISGGVFIGGIETSGTYTAGQKYYLSNTAGAISTTAGENEVLLGIGDDNGDLVFLNLYDPESVTKKEKDALAGTQGTPSADNKYVTADNLSIAGVDQSQTTDDVSIEVGQADATTNKVTVAQSFNPTRSKLRGVTLKMAPNTGNFVGTTTVAIQADNSGNPSGTDLVSKTLNYKTNVTGELEFEFDTEYTSIDPESEDPYWIVVSTSTTDNANHVNVRANSAGGYADGQLKYNNTTDGWVSISGHDLYFKTLEGITDQVVKTEGKGIPTKMFDVEKMPVPMYDQCAFRGAGSGSSNRVRATASNEDGSIIVIYDVTQGMLRFERSSVTGRYRFTHSVSITGTNVTILEGSNGAVVGDYVYFGGRDQGTPDTWGVLRFDLADLANETEMAMPTISLEDTLEEYNTVWTDGTYLYMQVRNNTTVYQFEIDGTTLTTVTTGTINNDMKAVTTDDSVNVFNGKDIYRLYRVPTNNGSRFTLYKASDKFFNAYTTVWTKDIDYFDDANGGGATDQMFYFDTSNSVPAFAMVDDKRGYIIVTKVDYDNGTDRLYTYHFYPIDLDLT